MFVRGLKGVFGFCKYLPECEYKALMREFPILTIEADEKLRAFFCRFMVLLWQYAQLYDDADLRKKPLVISRTLIAILRGVSPSYHGFNAKKLLLLFKCKVLPNFRWRKANHVKNKARRVAKLGFTDSVMQSAKFFHDEWASMTRTERERAFGGAARLVNVVTGQIYTRTTAKNERIKAQKKSLQQAQKRAANTRNNYQNQIEILKYHCNPRQNRAVKICVNKNAVRANEQYMEEVEKYQKKLKRYKQRKQNGAKLEKGRKKNWFYESSVHFKKLLQDTVPVYKLGKKTARVIPATWPSLTNIPKAIRNELLAGTFCADLASIQLAALANILHFMELHELLGELAAQGKKIWDYLIASLPKTGLSDELLKSAIKTSIYSMAYGACENTMQKPFKKKIRNKSLAKDVIKTFFTMPLINELYKRRTKWLVDRADKIMKSKKVDDETARKEARSQLACEAQAIEQMVMAAIYREACDEIEKPNPLFYILVNLYDGVIVAVNQKSKVAAVTKRLQKAVDEAIIDKEWIGSDYYNDPNETDSSAWDGEYRWHIQTFLEVENISTSRFEVNDKNNNNSDKSR